MRIAILLAIAASLSACEQESIITAGSNIAKLDPDYVVVSGSVRGIGNSTSEAISAASQHYGAIIEALKKAKFDAAKLRVSQFVAEGNCEWRQTPTGGVKDCTGYDAEPEFAMELDDLARTGELLAILAAAGAQKIEDPQFMLRDDAKARAAAEASAIDDARRDAEAYAAKAGRKVGRVLRIEDADAQDSMLSSRSRRGRYSGAPLAFMDRAPAESAPSAPISIAKVEVAAQVYVEFALE